MSNAFDFRQVKPRLLYETAADQIRRAIHAGKYAPGSRLNEVELARSLSLSRGPVREALRLLEQEGVVTSEPQKGVRVAQISRRDAADALAVRETLETLASEETAANVNDEDIADLTDIIDAMSAAEQAGDILDAVDLDYAFHERFLEIASTETTKRVWRSIAGQIRMYQALGDTTWMESGSVAQSHQPILDALKSRDSTGLHAAIISHIEENRSSIRNL
ncbi:GntR family transcriptional regulator [Rhodococcus koreensis]